MTAHERPPAAYREAWSDSAFEGTHGDVLEEVCRRIRDFCIEVYQLPSVDVHVTVHDDAGHALYHFARHRTLFVADPPPGRDDETPIPPEELIV